MKNRYFYFFVILALIISACYDDITQRAQKQNSTELQSTKAAGENVTGKIVVAPPQAPMIVVNKNFDAFPACISNHNEELEYRIEPPVDDVSIQNECVNATESATNVIVQVRKRATDTQEASKWVSSAPFQISIAD